MRRRPSLSPEAAADLEEIRQYTAERFGEEQARRYLSGLWDVFEHLVSHPDAGREIAADARMCLGPPSPWRRAEFL